MTSVTGQVRCETISVNHYRFYCDCGALLMESSFLPDRPPYCFACASRNPCFREAQTARNTPPQSELCASPSGKPYISDGAIPEDQSALEDKSPK